MTGEGRLLSGRVWLGKDIEDQEGEIRSQKGGEGELGRRGGEGGSGVRLEVVCQTLGKV